MTAPAGRLPVLVQAFLLNNPEIEVEIDEVSTTADFPTVFAASEISRRK